MISKVVFPILFGLTVKKLPNWFLIPYQEGRWLVSKCVTTCILGRKEIHDRTRYMYFLKTMYEIWNFDDDRKFFKLQHDSYADCRFICVQFIKLTSNEFIELELKWSLIPILILSVLLIKNIKWLLFQFSSTMGVTCEKHNTPSVI